MRLYGGVLLLVVLCARGTGKIIFLEHLGLQLESSSSDKAFPSIVWSCRPPHATWAPGKGTVLVGDICQGTEGPGVRGTTLGLAPWAWQPSWGQWRLHGVEVWGLLPFLVGCRTHDRAQ